MPDTKSDISVVSFVSVLLIALTLAQNAYSHESAPVIPEEEAAQALPEESQSEEESIETVTRDTNAHEGHDMGSMESDKHVMSMNHPGLPTGWIVPIMNYFRPYQIIRDLWQKSDPEPGTRGTTQSVPGTYNAWWAAFLISNQVGRVVLRTQETETLEQLQTFAGWALALDLIAIPSLVFAAIVIRTLTARQIEAGAALGRHLAGGQ